MKRISYKKHLRTLKIPYYVMDRIASLTDCTTRMGIFRTGVCLRSLLLNNDIDIQ